MNPLKKPKPLSSLPGASIRFVSLFLVFTHGHASLRVCVWGALLSPWQLYRPLTNALPLCEGVPMASTEWDYLFLTFLKKEITILSVPQ